MLKTDRTIRIAFIISLIVWIILAFMNVFGFHRYYSIYYEQDQTDAVHTITPLLEDYSERLDLFSTMFISTDSGINETDFDDFAETLINGNVTIDYIMFSPHGDVGNVYPVNEDLLGKEIVNDFNLDEFARFNTALNNDTYFLTYEYDRNTLTKILFHKANVVDNEFKGLVTIVVDVDKFVASLPNAYANDEFVIYSSDGVFIKTSAEYNEEDFTRVEIEVEGYNFYLATNFYGAYYIRTIIMVILATLLVTAPLVIIFMIFYDDQKRTKTLMYEVEYSQNYSAETKLKNAKSFYNEVKVLIDNNETFYLSLGTFNNIKYINDKYGHDLGLNVILEAINLIKGVLRANTELYHFGGNEYIFIIKTENKSEVNNILKRVLKIFDRDIVMDRIRTNISMTMGVVNYPTQCRSIDEMVKNAHLTISNAHIMNSNAFAFFEKDIINNMLSNQDFDNYVKNLNLELFEVYVMPIIDVETNIIVGFECLTRAFNEFDEMLDTETVVNSLERKGRIQELDEIVFTKMLRMMRRLNTVYPGNDFFLSVNASALSFNESYVDNVINLYEQENLAAGTIVLELTESYQVEDYDYLIRLFKRLNNVGIKTAIDDFGSGYSSLSYISKFPIYAIKVDKEYVRDYLTNSFNRTLFMTLRSIAEVLGCKLIAEGVDDPETLDFLRKNNCELYQGFLFSKGVTFEQSLKMIKKNVKEYSEE
jgi:diguanylate cyclase (GGDEF)-like protein